MNDSSNVGIGLKWLNEILKRKNNDEQQFLSQSGKMILETLLRENKLHEEERERHGYNNMEDDDDSDDEEDDDDSDNHFMNLANYQNLTRNWKFLQSNQNSQRRRQQQHSFELFPTLLHIVNEVYCKLNNATTSTTSTTTEATTIPTTKQIIEAFNQKLESKSMSSSKILPSSHIPASLDSNQLLFSALLFLAEDLHQDIDIAGDRDDVDAMNRVNNISGKYYQQESSLLLKAAADPYYYFPVMPLLRKHVANNDSKSNSKKDSSLEAAKESMMEVPYGFEVNNETISQSSFNDLMNNDEFLHKLSLLESCFWSIPSMVEHTPRIHILPGTIIPPTTKITKGIITKEDMEKCFTSGSVQGTALEVLLRKPKSNASNNKKLGEKKGKNKVIIKRKIDSALNENSSSSKNTTKKVKVEY